MSMKYAKQHDIPLVRKITPRTFESIKPGENLRVKYETAPFWVVNHIHREQLILDVFEKWKPIYLGIPWFRKWNPKINWRSMQVTIKTNYSKSKKGWSAQKVLGHLPGKIKQITTNLQRWNLYHQNTRNTATYSKSLKK